jgi:hypothetical protein
MLQHRHIAAHFSGDRRVDAGGGPADAIGDLGDDLAPGIADQRVAVGEAWLALALQVLAVRGGGGEPALGLDRAAADEDLPVVFSGGQGEGRGQEDQVGAALAQGPEQVGEADVVAVTTSSPAP